MSDHFAALAELLKNVASGAEEKAFAKVAWLFCPTKPLWYTVGRCRTAVPVDALHMLIHAYGQLTTPFGATALEYLTAALGLHPLAKAMNALAATNFWLVCTLWHNKSPYKKRGLSPRWNLHLGFENTDLSYYA